MTLQAPAQQTLRSRSSLQAVRLATDEYEAVGIGAASARTTVAVNADFVFLLADQPCHINIGDNTVVATTGNTKIPAGVPIILQIERGEWISVIQVAANGGVLGITPAY